MKSKINYFSILGAARAGTTSLYHYLEQHPAICMSDPKETPFFPTSEYKNGLDHYWKKYFSGWNGEIALGEANPSNLYLADVPHRIRHTIPESKLIVILRNPVDRAISHWRMAHPGSPVGSIVDKDLREIRRGRPSADFHYLDYRLYAPQLKRYMDLFPESQLKIILFEDLSNRPEPILKSLFNFIDVNPDILESKFPSLNASFNNGTIGQLIKNTARTRLQEFIPKGWRKRVHARLTRIGDNPQIGSQTRLQLAELYYESNRELEKLLNCDLSSWDR
jgi:hypothetical protein